MTKTESFQALFLPLFKKPLFSLAAAMILFLAFFTGFLYLPAADPSPANFEEEKDALEEALLQAEKKWENAPEENKAILLESVLFYETALEFRLPVWSSYFAEAGAGAYARLLLAEKNGGMDLQEEKTQLKAILEEKDKDALLSYLDEKRRSSGFYSEEELQEKKEEDLLLLSLDTNLTPGESAILYEIRLLKESLESGTDRYGGSDMPLSENEEKHLARILSLRMEMLASDAIDPVPANDETLFSGERICALFITLLLLFAVFHAEIEKKGDPLRLLFPLVSLLLALVLAAALTLWGTTALFAPGTATAFCVLLGRGSVAIPFPLALILRLFCRCLSDAPLILLSLLLRTKHPSGRYGKPLALFPLLRYLLQSLLPLFPGSVSFVYSLFDLTLGFFPEIEPFAPPVAPLWASLFVWCIAIGLILFLVRKEKKRS